MHAGEKILKKVFFVIPTLAGGGAERVMVHLLNNIDKRKFDPYLVLFQRKGAFLKELPDDTNICILSNKDYALGFKQFFEIISLISLINKNKPAVIVSFMWYTNVISLLAKMLCKIECKVIVAERTTLSFTNEGRIVGWIRRWTIRYFYPVSHYYIAQTKQMRQELIEKAHLQSEKIKIIHNPIDIHEIKKMSKKQIDMAGFNPELSLILSVGRLTIEKGYNNLIRAFSHVNKKNDAYLMILGEGEERHRLERLVKKLGVKENVFLPGFEKNPYKYLAHSTMFVLPSLYEGFPNALLESLSLGVPSIATRCQNGPSEIITDGVDGILVPPTDESALVDALKQLLVDKNLRNRLGEAGKKRAMDFRVEKIIKQYEEVIEAVCLP
jgi:glycosyltransferase involved in cell wall biosynthesis